MSGAFGRLGWTCSGLRGVLISTASNSCSRRRFRLPEQCRPRNSQSGSLDDQVQVLSRVRFCERTGRYRDTRQGRREGCGQRSAAWPRGPARTSSLHSGGLILGTVSTTQPCSSRASSEDGLHVNFFSEAGYGDSFFTLPAPCFPDQIKLCLSRRCRRIGCCPSPIASETHDDALVALLKTCVLDGITAHHGSVRVRPGCAMRSSCEPILEVFFQTDSLIPRFALFDTLLAL